ncbi:unnamed protein product [Clavelina lepadiformis]|uniref:EF-hand domain-containing protein n=1 Tax=Clavelina lepadiformis TaxID=159417 RepID=A0ABP0FG28_CLALP
MTKPGGFMLVLLLWSVTLNVVIEGRSVTHKKDGDKKQAVIDKEVLFEDDDYDDDDVLDLSQDEQKSRLKKLVEKKIDANHDGFVDLPELQSWSLKAFDAFDTDDTKEEFKMTDSNKDGVVTWGEHADDIYGEDFSEENPEDERTLQQYHKDKKLFTAADVDLDGSLSLEEYLTFKLPRRSEKTSAIIVKDVLERLDKDGDGEISLEEFLNENPEEDESVDSTDRFNDELDHDGNGLLNAEEILHWMEPDNKEDAHDEAEHLMNESDANEDEKLTSSEIVNNHDLWVESDATDYGRQLMNHDEF